MKRAICNIVRNKMLRISPSIYILEESPEIYQIIFTSTRKVKRFSVDNLVQDVIKTFGEPIEVEDVVSKLKGVYLEKDLRDAISSLKGEGILREYNPLQEKSKFSKQKSFLDELTTSYSETEEIQRRIENTNVSVFGVGGIGTWIVNGLGQIGIRNIRITDPDVVEESNLNRQLFFNSNDIGKYKVDVLKDKLPDLNIQTFKKKVDEETNLEEIISGANFLINCADSPSIHETTRIIDRYASKYKIPYCVSGGYNLHLGMVGPIIVPGESATFQDFLEYQKERDPLNGMKVIKNIENNGNLGPIAGAVANMQVMEIFKFLSGKGSTNINRFFEVDFLDFETYWRDFAKNEK
jgi:molybdopterin-synthase adenylyltransferase